MHINTVTFALSSALAIACSWAQADIYILDTDARGWSRSTEDIYGGQTHNGGQATSNYLVGNYTQLDHDEAAEYRNWFSFDLSSISEEIISAELLIFSGSVEFSQSSPSIVYSLTSYDFQQDFDTMGTGELYGQHEYAEPDEQNIHQITLNVSALGAMNSTNTFGMSGRISEGADFGGDNFNQFVMGGTKFDSVQLVVTTIPSPSALAPLGLSLLPVARRRRS